MQSIFLDPDPKVEYLCYNKTYSTGFTKLMKFVMLTKQYPELLTNIRELIEMDKSKPKSFKSFLGIDDSLINKQNDKGFTALTLACPNVGIFTTNDTVQLLIDLGANVNCGEKTGMTAIMLCQPECIHLLINAGANLNTKNKDGFTALMYYSSWGHNKQVEILINAGALLDLQNSDGATALMLSKNPLTVTLLLNAGADPSLKNNKGKTALTIATENKNDEIVELLKNVNTVMTDIFNDPNPTTSYPCYKTISSTDFTKLMRWVMISINHPELLANIKCVEKNLIDQKNTLGYTALMLACANKLNNVTEILINLGADVNLCNNDGKTALMLASECNADYIVNLLIAANANINIMNNDEMTALTIAAKFNCDSIVKILKNAHCLNKANSKIYDTDTLLFKYNKL